MGEKNAEKGTGEDYNELSTKIGLEVHQQLEGKKLFCSCPTIIQKGNPDYKVSRVLRASAGETGEIDAAAKHEMIKKKTFIYQGYEDITCLVELDSEPPHEVNKEALKTALQVAKLLNCNIVDRIYFMRKVVVDGSNTSGFQRTALVGTDGWIKVNGKRITVPTVCLEEEACQVVKRTNDYDIYNLSRQGIPLIEIATGPDISTPEECKEAASHLGLILRSVKGIKRGIGTIRQDVNISIKNGSRVEIKGFQDLRSIPKVVNYEIERQLKLIKYGRKVNEEVRKAEPDFTTSYLRPMPGSARMYPETDSKPIVPELKEIEDIGDIELIHDRIEKIHKKTGIDKHLIKIILKQDIDLLSYLEKYKKIKPMFIADYFVSFPKELRKRYSVEVNVAEFADELFGKLNNNELPKEAVIEILAVLGKGKKPDYSKYKGISDGELEKELKAIVEKNKGAPFKALMGMAMHRFRGKVDGKKVSDVLKKICG